MKDASLSPADDSARPKGLWQVIRERGRRWTAAILVVGLLLCLLPVLRVWPRDWAVELRLTDPASVTSVSITWTAGSDPTPMRHSVWSFAPGKAPRRVATALHANPGAYRAVVTVERETDEGRVQTEIAKEITFGDDSVTSVIEVQ